MSNYTAVFDAGLWHSLPTSKNDVRRSGYIGGVRLASLGRPRSASVRSNSFDQLTGLNRVRAPSALLVERVTCG